MLMRLAILLFISFIFVPLILIATMGMLQAGSQRANALAIQIEVQKCEKEHAAWVEETFAGFLFHFLQN